MDCTIASSSCAWAASPRVASGCVRPATQRATNAFAFAELRLHRIMANYRPENTRSAQVLERLGFRREGIAHDYLFIDGAWRDHVLTALVHPTYDPSWVEPAGRS